MPKKTVDTELLQAQIAELTEALSRERADAMNVRRRAEEDRLKLASFYKAMVLKELLPALDNLDRALKHTPKDLVDHEYVKGVQGVAKQFNQALEKIGVTRIKTVGEVFNPSLHEAISMEDEGGAVELISEELQPGYLLGDEVLRHAMVRVKM
jgi:molecular chaperone GrpE